MRSLALTAFGTFIASIGLLGQSLTEHAAAAAGATIGTAAGKPLGTALGNIFNSVDKSTSKAATPAKTAKPAVAKPAPAAEPTASVAPAPATIVGGGSVGGGDVGGGSPSGGGSSHRARRREAREEPVAEAPKQPTVQEVASIKVGATAGELREALGAPESSVSVPDDDGHLRETFQYWANGTQIGTIRLDNGRVVSVQTSN